MKKNLTFSKKKYFNACLKKLIIFVFGCLLFYLFLIILNNANGIIALLKIILIIMILGFIYLILIFYIDYKYYNNENFKCEYDDKTLSYDHFRFAKFFENPIFSSSNYIKINLEVNRIDNIVLKFGKIHIYGLMTLETESFRVKQKIIKKYAIPDYFNETKDLLKEFN